LTQELTLCLHGIGEPHAAVTAQEAHFWISRQAFTTLLDRVAAGQETNTIPTIITFDDGNLSDVQIALPELAGRRLKAMFFVCAGRIGKPHYLDRVAIAELVAAGMQIGTHGKDHRDWRNLDDAALDAELPQARRQIEDACGMPVAKAAIPFGSYDRRVLARLRRERFECVYSADRGVARADAWLKSRDTMDRTWQEPEIEQVLAGQLPLKLRLRRAAARLYKRLR
jgi:peptidoglycan/xylan/chitin deacetylase (PgdA/CDA1 family)